MEVEEATAMLESLSRQSSCLGVRTVDETRYMACSFVVGIYEYHLKAIYRELAELMEEHFPFLVSSCLATTVVVFALTKKPIPTPS